MEDQPTPRAAVAAAARGRPEVVGVAGATTAVEELTTVVVVAVVVVAAAAVVVGVVAMVKSMYRVS